MNSRTASRGFTLIELLVVVAIIGMLASVILSSLRDARLKAADASVRQEMTQLRTIMEQERTNSGTYTAIKNGGSVKAPGSSCAVGTFSGQFATQAAAVCTSLVAAAGTGSGASTGCGVGGCVYFQQTSPNASDKFSIWAYLPYASIQAGAARYLCMGSSGNQSISIGQPGGWAEDGCYTNP